MHHRSILVAACLAACDPTPSPNADAPRSPATAPAQANGAQANGAKAAEATPPPTPTPPPSCDGPTFDAIAGKLASASDADKPEIAVRGLVEHCDGVLPPRLRMVVRTLLPENEAELMRTVKGDAVEQAVWDRACPKHAEVIKAAMTEVPSTKRAGFLYDGCDFVRLDLMSKDELAARPWTGLPPWVVHQWQLDSGASEASAKSISLAVFDQMEKMN